jgi:peptidoglycan/xylan/chitin deacetylase (PgdA/CDA1 family)
MRMPNGCVAIALLCWTAITSEAWCFEDKRSAEGAAPVCWTQQELAARAGEEQIRREVSQPTAAPERAQPTTFSPIRSNMRGSIRSVRLPPGKKLIALTFDLCEALHEIAGYHGEIVDILRANDVKATFFAGGKWMMSHRERAQQLMSDKRFEIGNHTWAHRNLRLLTGSAVVEEIRGAEAAYQQLRRDLADKQCTAVERRGVAPEFALNGLNLFRFPFGACDPKSLETIGDLGLLAIQWDVTSDDPDPKQTPDRITKGILDEVRPGSIVLFHANGRGWWTDDALPEIIATLKARGYEFATVTELLNAGEPEISASCYDRTRGDTDQYDELARHLEEQ